MPRSVAITYTCDVCGKALDEVSAIAFAVSLAKPGADANGEPIKAISCPDGQHYGCTLEHAVQAAKACVDHLAAQAGA